MSCFWSRLDLPGSLGPPLPGSGTALHEYIEAGGLKMLYSVFTTFGVAFARTSFVLYV